MLLQGPPASLMTSRSRAEERGPREARKSSRPRGGRNSQKPSEFSLTPWRLLRRTLRSKKLNLPLPPSARRRVLLHAQHGRLNAPRLLRGRARVLQGGSRPWRRAAQAPLQLSYALQQVVVQRVQAHDGPPRRARHLVGLSAQDVLRPGPRPRRAPGAAPHHVGHGLPEEVELAAQPRAFGLRAAVVVVGVVVGFVVVVVVVVVGVVVVVASGGWATTIAAPPWASSSEPSTSTVALVASGGALGTPPPWGSAPGGPGGLMPGGRGGGIAPRRLKGLAVSGWGAPKGSSRWRQCSGEAHVYLGLKRLLRRRAAPR